MPAILPVCLSRTETFLVAIVYGLPEQIRSVLIDLVIATAPIVTVDRSRVIVGVAIVIVFALVAKADLLLTFALQIIFLETILRQAILSLQLRGLLLRDALLLIELTAILRQTLLLLLNELLLALL